MLYEILLKQTTCQSDDRLLVAALRPIVFAKISGPYANNFGRSFFISPWQPLTDMAVFTSANRAGDHLRPYH